MKHKITKNIILELTEAEAAWLHMVMQNPLGNPDPDKEDPTSARMRRMFYEATDPRN